MTESSIRCAVYTRKSSEKGLEQAFNSLDAQREAGLDYIKSQKHQGWVALPTKYDDGGYSGGSTDRPGLQRLLVDIQSRRVDVVVVYKVDRLSRSLADFARLMQTFDEQQVSFVSVTQQFNTTTSMGRLTLNMLLSFAQFEREVTGERIRDKIAATKRRGIWVGGIPPIGYRLPRAGDDGHTPGDRTLRIVEPEAAIVRAIFDGYVETGSLVTLVNRLRAGGHTTKRWQSAVGRPHGGRTLTTSQVYRILTNPIYLGKITHTRKGKTEVYDAAHQPIVTRALWDRVQSRMERLERETRHRWTRTHLLQGKIRTCEGFTMSPQSVQKVVKRGDPSKGMRLTRYYTSQKALKQGYASCPIRSINGGHVDDLTRALVMDYLKATHGVTLWELPPEQRDHWIREIVHKVVLAPDLFTIEIERERIPHVAALISHPDRGAKQPAVGAASKPTDLAASCEAMPNSVPTCPYTPHVDDSGPRTILTLRIQMKRFDGRRVLLSPDGDDLLLTIRGNGARVPNARLVQAVGRAFAWRRELLKSGDWVSTLCQRFGVTDSWIHQLLALTQLSPSILRGVLTGQLRPSIRLDDLLAAAQQLDWAAQRRILKLK